MKSGVVSMGTQRTVDHALGPSWSGRVLSGVVEPKCFLDDFFASLLGIFADLAPEAVVGEVFLIFLGVAHFAFFLVDGGCPAR